MTDNELDMLARHLGHDVKTHKENYRLSHSTRELTKVSQLLIAVESGFVNKWKGKNLSEVSVDDLFLNDQDASGMCLDQNAAEDDLKDKEVDSIKSSEDGGKKIRENGREEDNTRRTKEDHAKNTEEDHITNVNGDIETRTKTGRRGTKRCWTVEETDCLRKKFRGYLMGVQKSVHQHELREVQRMCPTRTLPQLRAKLNNIKLGKSN
ncbi:uncharacterized protein LOC144621567 [Crassostrea virginica]